MAIKVNLLDESTVRPVEPRQPVPVTFASASNASIADGSSAAASRRAAHRQYGE